MSRVLCILLITFAMCLTVSGAQAVETTVAYPDLVQCVHWTRGCTPTAAAMMLSYYDTYAPSIGNYLWGFMIDYYMGDGCNNIPNILHELADAMETTSWGATYGGNITTGLRTVVEEINGYTAEFNEAMSFDGAWNILRSETGSWNRPCLWTIGAEGNDDGHTTAAWGYDDYLGSRWVILYDTWDYCPERPYWQYKEKWNMYLFYYPNGTAMPADYSQLNTVEIDWDACPERGVIIDDPYGGEVLKAGNPYTIWWYQFGPFIDYVRLYFSIDNGYSWQPITDLIPAEGEGWHSYTWNVPCINSSIVRIRVITWNIAFWLFGIPFGTSLASDGSFGACSIQPDILAAPAYISSDRNEVEPDDMFLLSWGSVDGADSYELHKNGNSVNVGNTTSYSTSEPNEGQYLYTVRATDSCGNCGLFSNSILVNVSQVTDADDGLLVQYRLYQNQPNPFNPATTIYYDLPCEAKTDIRIFDATGRLVKVLKSGIIETAGRHQVIWNGSDKSGNRVTSGVYFCKMKAGTFEDTNKMILLQ